MNKEYRYRKMLGSRFDVVRKVFEEDDVAVLHAIYLSENRDVAVKI